MTITKIADVTVETKKVTIMNRDFALVKYAAPNDRQREVFGEFIYGLIPYDCIGDDGCLTKALNGYDMAVSESPEHSIRMMKFGIQCENWKAEHPNATEDDFRKFMLTIC